MRNIPKKKNVIYFVNRIDGINYYNNNITTLLTVSVSLSMLSSIQDECLRERKEGDFDSAAEL